MDLSLYFFANVSLLLHSELVPSPNDYNTNRPEIVENNICDTKECHRVAETIAGSMDRTVEPCDDFYKFSCGNWELRNPPPKYEKKWDSRTQQYLLAETRLKEELETEATPEDLLPIKNIKKLYKLCMDIETREMEGLQKIEAILRETKGWPMIMNNYTWNSSSVTWQEVERYYTNLTSQYAFLTLESFETEETSQLSIGRKTFPLRKITYRFHRDYTDDGIAAYRSVIRKIAQVFISQNSENVSDEQLEKDIDDLLKFEESIYEIQWTNFRFPSTNISVFIEWWNVHNKPSTLKGMIHWEPFFQRLYNIANNPTEQPPFFLDHLNALAKLVEILDATDERTIVNYIHWYFLSTMLPYTTEEVNDIMFENQKADLGVQERPPRWLECTRQIETEHAAAYLFGRKYYQNSAKAAVDAMFRNNKVVLKRHIENSNWLPVAGKEAAINRLNRLSMKSGYPDWYDNETAFVDYYANWTVGDSYFENILKLKNLGRIEYIKNWGKHIPQPRWTLNILDPTSLYLRDYLLMNIPAAALQSPLLDAGLPDYAEYGTIGTLIGQEAGHFAYRAFERDLGDEIAELHENALLCFYNEYDVWHAIFDRNYRTIHSFVVSNFVSDWIGMQTSLDVYKINKNETTLDGELKLPGFDTFTDDQMFFISYAQTHCTTRPSATYIENFQYYEVETDTRVNQVLNDTLAFAKTFNCSKNSPMNPVEKCNYWMGPTNTS